MVTYREYAKKIITDCLNMPMYTQINFKPKFITFSISKQDGYFTIDDCSSGWITAKVDLYTLKKCIVNPSNLLNLRWE